MMQPNRTAGFEVTARALFRAFCDASSRHSVCNPWKEHLGLEIKFKTFKDLNKELFQF